MTASRLWVLSPRVEFLVSISKVFEIGSAEGRDARYLRKAGLEVLCTDVIPQALDELAHDGFQTSLYDFRDEPKEQWVNSFDGVFAKAVFLHAPQEVLENALTKISRILKECGILCVTFKLGTGEEIETGKLGGARYFKYYTRDELEAIFAKRSDFEIVDIQETTDPAKWVKTWIQIIARKK